MRQLVEDRPRDGQAPEPRVEDADGSVRHGSEANGTPGRRSVTPPTPALPGSEQTARGRGHRAAPIMSEARGECPQRRSSTERVHDSAHAPSPAAPHGQRRTRGRTSLRALTLAAEPGRRLSGQQLAGTRRARTVVRQELRCAAVAPAAAAHVRRPSPGRVPCRSRAWAAVLVCRGRTRSLSHDGPRRSSSGWSTTTGRVEVTVRHGAPGAVPTGRPGPPGRRRRRTPHPSRLPPQTRLEDTVLDLDGGGAATKPCRRSAAARLPTTAHHRARLAAAARAGAARLRWRPHRGRRARQVRRRRPVAARAPVSSATSSAHTGSRAATRNRPEGTRGARVYRDVRVHGVAAGRRAGRTGGAPRRAAGPRRLPRQRGASPRESVRTFRYGWRSVTARPARRPPRSRAGLERQGWPGRLRAAVRAAAPSRPRDEQLPA